MTSKTGRRFVIALGAVLCLGLWPADGAAQSSAWEEARTAAVEAYRAGDYATAEQNFLAAVDHAKKFGPRDPRLAATLNDLAFLYVAQGRYTEAEPMHMQVLEIRRKTLGADHPLVAQSLEHYAVLMIDTGRDAEARWAQTFAASIRERNAKANEPKPEAPDKPQKRAALILETSD